MAADKEIIKHLNVIIKNELTAINQYFLHARILKHQGFMKFADYEYKESIDEMKHADMLIERVLFLGGIPNLQDLGKLLIGETVEEILACDLKIEFIAQKDLKAAIVVCEAKADFATADILHAILTSEEDHINYIQTQQRLIESMGIANYMQTQV